MTTSTPPPADVDVVARLRAGPAGADPEAHRRARAAAAAAADRLGLADVACGAVDSPVGTLHVAATDAGVVCIAWAGDDWQARVAATVSPRIVEAPARVDEARRQLDQYFAHQRRAFELTLDWRLSGGFRRQVLQALAEVPFGVVVTYGELAERVGRPGAARAVGSAMAANPVPIVVPCHRVLRTGGGLGGYSGRGGLGTKRALLALEGVVLGVG